MVCIFGFRLSGLFEYFCQSEQESEKRSIRTANRLNKTRWRFFCRLPSAFYSFLEELDKENTETRKNIREMDDLLIFMMLEKHKKLAEMTRPVRSKFRREIVRSDCSLRLVLSLMKHKIVCGSENQDLDWLIETQP